MGVDIDTGGLPGTTAKSMKGVMPLFNELSLSAP